MQIFSSSALCFYLLETPEWQMARARYTQGMPDLCMEDAFTGLCRDSDQLYLDIQDRKTVYVAATSGIITAIKIEVFHVFLVFRFLSCLEISIFKFVIDEWLILESRKRSSPDTQSI